MEEQKMNLDAESIREEKKNLRKRIVSVLRALGLGEIKRRTQEVERKLQASDHYKNAHVVMMFWPMSGEVDLRDFIRKAREEGKRIALPVIQGDSIEPYEFVGEEHLKTNMLGVKEPSQELTKPVEISSLDLVLVPGVAFDAHGNRLGRGGGYYDRFLARLSDPVCTIGIGFECQVQDYIPVSSHDRSVRYVITG
jgi:5-formyltetrahydrofolate cyclo-ligase